VAKKKTGAYVMGGPKGAPKAKPGTSLSTAQKYLGLVQNAQGQWVRPGAGLATKTLQASVENMGYTGGGVTGTRVPIGTPRGDRLGYVDNATGSFSLAGGKAGGSKAGTRKRRGKSAGGMAAPVTTTPVASNPFAEADVAATSLLRTQGKAFAAGRSAFAGTALGATRGPKAAEETKGKTKGKGKKGKGKGKARPRRPKAK
jgi:hypothetical protein